MESRVEIKDSKGELNYNQVNKLHKKMRAGNKIMVT